MIHSHEVGQAFFASLILYAVALPISMSATNFAAAFVVLFAVLALWKSNFRFPPRFWPLSLSFLAGFFFWAAITIIAAEKNFQFKAFGSFQKIWNFLPYVLIPLPALLTRHQIFRVVRVLIAVSAIVVVLGAFEYWFGIHYFFEGWFKTRPLVYEDRFYGFQSYPLHTGGLYMILYFVSLAVWLFHPTSRSQTLLWLLATALLGLGVVLTISRAYILAAGIGSLFLLGCKGMKYGIAGLALGLVVLVSLASFNPLLKKRLQTLEISRMDKSGEQRLFIWKCAVQMVKDHPMKGVGYRKWRERLPEYALLFPGTELEEALLGHAHNSYLTVAAETGLVGVLLFLAFWIFLLHEQIQLLPALKSDPTSHALALSTIPIIFALMVAGFFEHNLLTATISLAMAFVIGLSRAEVSGKGAGPGVCPLPPNS